MDSGRLAPARVHAQINAPHISSTSLESPMSPHSPFRNSNTGQLKISEHVLMQLCYLSGVPVTIGMGNL